MKKLKGTKVAKAEPSEQDLLKALDELEKGAIPSEMKDPNGGLATEGDSDELEVSADENVEKVTKGPKTGGDDESDDESEESEPASEDESDDESEESMSKADNEEETSSPGKGPHRTSSPSKEDGVNKSFREVAGEDETIQKAIEVSGFMEQLVSLTSDSVDSLRKSIEEMNEGQSTFNTRLRKAVTAIGNMTLENRNAIRSLVEKLGGVPAKREGKALLSKSEIVEREFEGGDGGGLDHSDPRTRARVADWLCQKAMKREIDLQIVTAYESGLGYLPDSIAKACENDLLKSSS